MNQTPEIAIRTNRTGLQPISPQAAAESDSSQVRSGFEFDSRRPH